MEEQTKFPGATDSSPDSNPEDKALVRHWNGVVESCWNSHEWFRKSVRDARKYVRGEQHDDGSGKLGRANLLYADIKNGVNRVYAKNPEISIRPAIAVDESRYEEVKQFARTCEVVLNRQLHDADLKRRAKAALRSADTTKVGWLKMDYQRSYELDPIMQNRINDTQDNLLQLQAAQEKLSDNDANAKADLELRRADLRVKLRAYQEQKEVIAAEGLVIDHVLSEHILLDTTQIRNIDEFAQAPWIAHCVPMSVEDARVRFGKKIQETSGYTLHRVDDDDDMKKYFRSGGMESPKSGQYIRVWEVWSKTDMTVFTFGEGGSEWLREPFSPDTQSEQWYPFFPYSPDRIDGDFYPLSKVDRLKELQDEHNKARTRFREMRDRHIPHTLLRKGAYTDNDVKAMANPDRFGFAQIEGQEGIPLAQDILPGINPQIDPQIYMTEHIERDWERSTNVADASRGFVTKPKTATEAAITDQANNLQSSGDSDELDDFLTILARSALEILLQELTVQQATRIAGDTAIWPPGNMSKEEVFNLVALEIRAGSTAKPNKAIEQQLWTQFGPQIMDTVMKTNELIGMKQIELAEITIEMLRESLRRFDVRIDLNDLFRGLILKIKQAQQGPTEADLRAQQRQEQMEQAQVDQIQATVDKTKADAFKDMALAKKATEAGKIDLLQTLSEDEGRRRDQRLQAMEGLAKAEGKEKDQQIALFNAMNKQNRGQQ